MDPFPYPRYATCFIYLPTLIIITSVQKINKPDEAPLQTIKPFTIRCIARKMFH